MFLTLVLAMANMPKVGHLQTVALKNPWFAPRIPVVVNNSVAALISANPALNSLFAIV